MQDREDLSSFEEERPKMRRFQTARAESKPDGAYDGTLHTRFVAWKELTSYSLKRISAMMGRSEAAISQYINLKYEGDIAAIEKDVAILLRREEELDFQSAREHGAFCPTQAVTLIWEVLQYCDETCQMGAVTGPAGIGKTETCMEYKRTNHKSVFITSDISTRRVSPLLRLIAKKMGGPSASYRSSSDLLHGIIDRLRDSHRLIIIDESHFLSWESFEAIRKIHDDAGVGIVCAGMQRLYDQMKGDGNKEYLYDQIYSRIAIYRKVNVITKDDVRLIANNLCPGLDDECIRFLFNKAAGPGKFRTAAKLLKSALKRHSEYGCPIDIHLFKEVEQFLMI